MAYWLAEQRRGQFGRPVMRFDPRYWTVNFPRPMMASVVTSGPESLRVDTAFYKSDDLAGLIWDSEDILDHPLLAYETNRDYRRLTLSFHWRSQGIMPLDAINGPTLTINGRDASGQRKAWYVRLWNYAAGTPVDAQITIKFSDLDGGFLLPSEADRVFAGDIDQMFISLVPPEFDGAGSSFARVREGWVELSQIRCDGEGVMLDTGDVMLPEHSLKMATGYDDAYNQTPERLIDQIRALGYRGTINHYVGMSHYFDLEPLGSDHYVSLARGALNTPCRNWHRNFAEGAKARGFDLIFSLSYELFNAHCWNDWKQRAENGDPALTGWVPPSTLLSPAHEGAMGYLRAVGRAFAAILKAAGQPVQFQIGEPWWWIMPDGRICLYDDAARAAFGALSVSIANIAGPKNPAQNAMLDRAGEMLAASTAALAGAVRDEAGSAGAQILLLVYLPTVLDPNAPEAQRANVPAGWAAPAFDILQLEDYDWVVAGNHGATERAVPAMERRLGYPIARQHYFAGFVLNRDAPAQWKEIDTAAARSRARGTAQTYVWALPQTSRDGYTHFEIGDEEAAVQAFDNVTFPIEIGAQASASPEFSTQIVTALSGYEARNSDWADARQSYDVGPGVRSEADLGLLLAFFRARRGPAKGFRFRDPFDHSSNAMTAPPTSQDQPLGTGDGLQTIFPLVKYYGAGAGGEAQQRRITQPLEGSIKIAVDGQSTAGWRHEQGRIVFDIAPGNGAILTAGFYFDVPVRFAEDRIEVNRFSFGAGEMASVPLIEIKDAL